MRRPAAGLSLKTEIVCKIGGSPTSVRDNDVIGWPSVRDCLKKQISFWVGKNDYEYLIRVSSRTHSTADSKRRAQQHARFDRVVTRARLHHMAMADDETTRLAGEGIPKAGSHERISLRGAALVFFAALAVFSLASVCARSIFPRGVKGRAASSKGEHQLGELASSPTAGLNKYEDGYGTLSSPQLASSPALQQEQDGEEEVLHSLSPGMGSSRAA